MEVIWEDLSKEDEEIESPKWHQEGLRETQELLHLGEEKKVDYHTAKKELRGKRRVTSWGGENTCWGSDFRTRIFRTVLFRDLR